MKYKTCEYKTCEEGNHHLSDGCVCKNCGIDMYEVFLRDLLKEEVREVRKQLANNNQEVA